MVRTTSEVRSATSQPPYVLKGRNGRETGMKLDRNLNGNLGRGKYAILNLRKLADFEGSGAFEGIPEHLQAAETRWKPLACWSGARSVARTSSF